LNSQALALEARLSTLHMVATSKAAHIGSCLSMLDILAVLYADVAQVNPDNLKDENRDLVIVSKGHAAAGLYSILGHRGFFPIEQLQTYCQNSSPFFGHVTAGDIPGVEFSTGSLGHGLAYGVGLAFLGMRRKLARRHFVLMSDGECNEGSVWESAMFAAHHNLENLTAIIDRNRQQSFGSTEDTLRLEPLADKWRSFGWQVNEIDGHDHSSLRVALSHKGASRPLVIIANTTKGKGVSFMEDDVKWHYTPPDMDQLQLALTEIEASRA